MKSTLLMVMIKMEKRGMSWECRRKHVSEVLQFDSETN